MVATPQALEQVVFADDGVLGALSPGQWLIDISTVGQEVIRSIAGDCRATSPWSTPRCGEAFPG
jgi:3-hydroxyisobutyrate dehydrogenase-like beta-hydroxyacid dehydrogenase